MPDNIVETELRKTSLTTPTLYVTDITLKGVPIPIYDDVVEEGITTTIPHKDNLSMHVTSDEKDLISTIPDLSERVENVETSSGSNITVDTVQNMINEHANNTDVHVTADEKQKLNDVSSKLDEHVKNNNIHVTSEEKGKIQSIDGIANDLNDLSSRVDNIEGIADGGISLDTVQNMINEHANNTDIHTTADEKKKINDHIADTNIHVTSDEKTQISTIPGLVDRIEAVEGSVGSSVTVNTVQNMINEHANNTDIHVTTNDKTLISSIPGLTDRITSLENAPAPTVDINILGTENPTANDVLGHVITKQGNGTFVIKNRLLNTFSYNEDQNQNGVGSWGENWRPTTAFKVEKNKVIDSATNEVFSNVDFDSCTFCEYGFSNSEITSFTGDMDNLVDGNTLFTASKLSSFSSNVLNLVNGSAMFSGSKITTINLKLPNLTIGSEMFKDCTSLTNVGLISLCNLTDGNNMFYNCTSLNRAELHSPMNLTTGYRMFYGCTALTELTINNQEYDDDGSGLNVLPNLKEGVEMFATTGIASFSCNMPSLINGKSMFYNCTNLTNFYSNTNSLKETYNMFFGCTNLTTFIGNLSSLIDGELTFLSCKNLKTFSADLSNLVYGNNMFKDCTKLNDFNSVLPNLKYGSNMFRECTSLPKISYVRSDLPSLIDGYYMFYNCTALTSFDGNMPSLVEGRKMFFNCTSLANFNCYDLHSLKNGFATFYKCYSLNEEFTTDLPSLVEGSNMFERSGIKKFIGNLSSLVVGDYMFAQSGLTTFSGDLSSLLTGVMMFFQCYLDFESLYNIADKINDLSHRDVLRTENWVWNDPRDGTQVTIPQNTRGQIHFAVSQEARNNENFAATIERIRKKGWVVNTSTLTEPPAPPSTQAVLSLNDEEKELPIYHFKKASIEKELKRFADYVDADGNYFVILGGQEVFGADMSKYKDYHSIEEAAIDMGLTKIDKESLNFEEETVEIPIE